MKNAGALMSCHNVNAQSPRTIAEKIIGLRTIIPYVTNYKLTTKLTKPRLQSPHVIKNIGFIE